MMTKVFDLLRSLGWYLTSFIYDLIDGLLQIIKELNAFDIINSLSNNQTFINFYNGAMAIAVTLFALFIVWRFVNKLLDPDEETTFKMIIMEAVKCGTLIMLSTFLFVQVSNFSITLSNYTGNIFETTSNSKMSDSMLTMFISYRDGYKNSEKFVLTGENKSVIITRYEKVKEQLRKIELLYLNNNEELSLFSSIEYEDLTLNRFQTIKEEN